MITQMSVIIAPAAPPVLQPLFTGDIWTFELNCNIRPITPLHYNAVRFVLSQLTPEIGKLRHARNENRTFVQIQQCFHSPPYLEALIRAMFDCID